MGHSLHRVSVDRGGEEVKLRIQDFHSNDYLSRMYFEPLRAYMRDQGFDIEYAPLKEELEDCVAIIHGDVATPLRIERLKNSGCKVCLIDINDSSYLSSSYIHTEAQNLVDLIFKVSGVPKQNEINETNLDRNFQIKLSREKYLPDEQWYEFEQIRHKIKPLPYVLWEPLVGPNEPVVPQSERSGKVLIRGGNHFWRVILFLRLMQDGMLDERSEFHTSAYFSPDMEQRFQYCDSCKIERQDNGRSLYDAAVRKSECRSPVTGWGIDGEFFGGPMYGRHEHGYWNNRCPHSFFWLAKQFEKHRGPLDHAFIERAFAGDMRPHPEFIKDLSHASYAGDLKWLNTVNLPPRFWEAASLGTPSFYADRAKDQDYWPEIVEDEHYYTFPEDMSQFGLDAANMPPKHWEHVSRSVKELYETKIRGTQYPISNALLEHMKNTIEEFCA